MGNSEQNYRRMFAMARENQTAIEQRDQRQREAEYLVDMHPEETGDVLQRALAQPTETHNQRIAREIESQERGFARARRRRERQAEPAPVDVDLLIATAIATERAFLIEVIGEGFAELMQRQREAINAELIPLRADLAKARAEAAEQKVRLCEMEIVNARLREELASRGTTIDLPALPLRGHRAN